MIFMKTPISGRACRIVGSRSSGVDVLLLRRAAHWPSFWLLSSLILLILTLRPALAVETLSEKIRVQTQINQYEADKRKTIVELQQFRRATTMSTLAGQKIKLTSLSPLINSWLLLEVTQKDRFAPAAYHLENPDPEGQKIELIDKPRVHLAITGKTGTFRCIPWQGSKRTPLDRAKKAGLPFSPICGGRLFLRTPVRGSRTTLEATTEFLRDNVWMGENLIGFVKDTFFKDSKMEVAKTVNAKTEGIIPQGLIATRLAKTPVVQTNMGLLLDGAPKGRLAMGAWYPLSNLPGIYASTLQPALISKDILGDKGAANRLEYNESRALVYLVAFDLSRFKIGYEPGTEHPRVDWSSRPSGAGRNMALPGPDGIGTVRPLVNTGMVSPALTKRVVATFAGGFKREHGAFRFGPYATTDHGKHYGFVVEGVVESKLKEDLATLYVLNDGTIGMKTWTKEDNKLLPRIKFARQNGVPLVVRDKETGKSVPGPLVRYWGPGNWSGDAEANLRTLRAGACMREAEGKQFLIYGYFSTATPSAMARSFQALSCDYAMLLDMNALEHTYLATYARKNGAIETRHLVPGMALVDKKKRDGSRVPRFLGFPDNRDFFYLYRKEARK